MSIKITSSRCALWIAVLVTGFGVALYFLAISKLAVNFPREDDFPQILRSTLDLNAATTTGERLSILLTQYGGHCPAFLKLVSLALYRIQGEVNFQAIIMAGNLGLLVLAAGIATGARRTLKSPVLLLLLPLLLLTPLHGITSLWACACFNNNWTMALSVLALLLLTSAGSRLSFLVACVLATLAAYTNAQGLISFVPGLLVLGYQRRWRDTVLWFALFAVLVTVFAINYRPSAHFPPEFSLRTAVFFPTMLASPISNMLLRLANPFRDILGVEGIPIVLFRAGCGVGLIALVFLLWTRQYHKRNLFLSAVIIFVLMVCVVVAVSRSGQGLGTSLAPRYIVVSLLFCICLAFALADSFAISESCKSSVLVAGLGLWLLSWCLYYPWVCQFSDIFTKAHERFLAKQTVDAVIWCPPDPVLEGEYREYHYGVLWQSYLSGLMPLGELKSPQLPLTTLRAIAMEDTGYLPVANPESKLVTYFQIVGDRTILSPASASPSQKPSGAVFLQQGRLYFSMSHTNPERRR